jgi:hypothetical protein
MRWISVDPVLSRIYDPQSLNRYSYVRNDPVNRFDPDGRQDEPFIVKVSVEAFLSFFAYYGIDLSYFPPSQPPIIGGSTTTLGVVAGGGGKAATPNEMASSALLSQKCRNIFGTPTIQNGKPIFTLDQLWNGTATGYKWIVKYEHMGANKDIATTGMSAITRDSNGYLWQTVTTIINLDAPANDPEHEYWANGTTRTNAGTLLHEFGHALQKLGFSPSPGGFVDEDDPHNINIANTNLINDKCLHW